MSPSRKHKSGAVQRRTNAWITASRTSLRGSTLDGCVAAQSQRWVVREGKKPCVRGAENATLNSDACDPTRQDALTGSERREWGKLLVVVVTVEGGGGGRPEQRRKGGGRRRRTKWSRRRKITKTSIRSIWRRRKTKRETKQKKTWTLKNTHKLTSFRTAPKSDQSESQEEADDT